MSMPSYNSTTADFFNTLMHHVEDMILNNRVPYAVYCTLLTSGMLIAVAEPFYS
jgi:hypothetical protein